MADGYFCSCSLRLQTKMPEGQSFERQHELTPQPRIDFKSVLEKGEVVYAWPFLGYGDFWGVAIKDDGKGLFRSEEGSERERPLRIQLELLAKLIDETLELGLVPEVVLRTIDLTEQSGSKVQKRGTLQRFIDNSELTYLETLNLVPDEEIIRASLFDHLIGAADRRSVNILFNQDENRLWLIDHDDFMFLDAKKTEMPWRDGSYSELLNEAVDRNLDIVVNETNVELLKKLVTKLNELLINAEALGVETPSLELSDIIRGIIQRAETILETKEIQL